MKTDLLCGITPEACSGVMVRKSSNLKYLGCIGANYFVEDPSCEDHGIEYGTLGL